MEINFRLETTWEQVVEFHWDWNDFLLLISTKVEQKEPEQNFKPTESLDQKTTKDDDKLGVNKDFPKFLAGETPHLAVHAQDHSNYGTLLILIFKEKKNYGRHLWFHSRCNVDHWT